MTTDTPTPSAPTASGSIWSKMVRAAKLDINLYEEVEHDSKATGQAFAVVLMVAVATGIGAAIDSVIIVDAQPISFLWGLL